MNYISFDRIRENKGWAFESVRSTEQWSHGYHRYPAKFLPDVVRKIIEDYLTKLQRFNISLLQYRDQYVENRSLSLKL